MEITVTKEYLGQPFKLTLSAPDVKEDLSKYNVEARITSVMSRECQRFAEITVVALKDKKEEEVQALEIKSRRSAGEVPGPNQTVFVGGKEADRRIVHQ